MMHSSGNIMEGSRRKTGNSENNEKLPRPIDIKRPPRVKSPGEDCKSPHDNQMDSGFMSGSNLLSSSSLSSEEVRTQEQLGTTQEQAEYHHSSSHDRSEGHADAPRTTSDDLDSGIDLSDRISSLNLSSAAVASASPSESQTAAVPAENKSKLAQLGLLPVHITILKEIFKKDNDGDTQLHIAVIRGFVEVVWHITRLLPHQALLDIPNNSGRTALHLAVASGDACLARHLIVCGASPVAKNRKGETPLHIACRTGDPAMVSGLTSQVTVFEVVAARLSYPPSHTPGLLAADLNNYDGQTCIHTAAQYGHKQILQHLTWYGADINAKDGKSGRTALHLAVEGRNKDLIQFLVESCRAAFSIQNYAGLTPYQLALANNAPEIISLLEELGTDKDPLPPEFSAEEDLDYEEESNLETDEDLSWSVDDLCIAGVSHPTLQYSNPIPVSTSVPLNADQFL